jgi:hypothetical protein
VALHYTNRCVNEALPSPIAATTAVAFHSDSRRSFALLLSAAFQLHLTLIS